jgi:hypothetical protein
MPALLKRMRARPRAMKPRHALQGLDVVTRTPVVTIDPTWKERFLRQTVMAQIAEWCFRIVEWDKREPGDPLRPRVPDIADDAFVWWQAWTTRVARRGRGAEAPSASELYEIAARSVRPSRPAGHQLYWRKSLAGPSKVLKNPAEVPVGLDLERLQHAVSEPDLDRRGLHQQPARSNTLLAKQAATAADVSRRTMYERLERGGRRISDFYNEADPVAALSAYLWEMAPAGRVAADRRTLRAELAAAGWTTEAARKFERRLRALPPEEQAQRLRRALARRAAPSE